MSVYKVDICGVTTSKLPVLKDDEKEYIEICVTKYDILLRRMQRFLQCRDEECIRS